VSLKLTDERRHFYLDKFKLSYHLPYLNHCMSKVSLYGKDVIEIGGSLPAQLVVDEIGVNSWTAVESPLYDDELGKANQYHRNMLDFTWQQELSNRYNQICLPIEDLP